MVSRRAHGAWDLGLRASLLVVLGVFACGEQRMVTQPFVPGVDGSVADTATPGLVDATVPGPPPVPEPPPPAMPPVAAYPRKNLYIVAHQDDDLGLMSPDLINRVRSGEPVRTLYLTSGDAGLDCNDYVREREEGVKQAYAQMAGVASEWDVSEIEVLGKLLRKLELRGSQVSLLFLGLHNGGYNVAFQPDLEMLWSGGRPLISSRTLDGRSRT
jgi:GlcNAc-PI de-N-acetylase